jgi:uncharacterized membrane protein
MSYGSILSRAIGSFLGPAAALFLLLSDGTAALGAELNASALGTAYSRDIRPLLERYCHDCHGASDVVEGDINLAATKSWDDATKLPKTWQKIAEMLGNGLMPPHDAVKPTKQELATLQQWVAD